MCACLLRSISPLLPPSIPSAPSSWIPLLYFTMACARVLWLYPVLHHCVLPCSLVSAGRCHVALRSLYSSLNFHPVYRNVPCCVLSVCWSLLLTQTVWATLWCTVFVPDTYCICRSLLDSWLDHTSLCCAVRLQPVPVMVSGATMQESAYLSASRWDC